MSSEKLDWLVEQIIDGELSNERALDRLDADGGESEKG